MATLARVRALPLALAFLVPSCWGLTPGTRISQYAHTAWRVQDGAFDGVPAAIAQGPDGYIWIGTANGLVRFDGVRFARQPQEEAVFSLLADRDGGIWVGSTSLTRVKNGQTVRYPHPGGRINAIREGRDGTVWYVRSRVRDDNGPLCSVTGMQVRCYGSKDGIPVGYATSLAYDGADSFWIGTSEGIIHWRPGQGESFFPSALKSAAGLVGVEGLATDRDGTPWVGIARHGAGLGLQRVEGGEWKPFISPQLDGTKVEVIAILRDRQNSVWVGTTTQGLYRINQGRVDHVDSDDGLSGDHVNGLAEDREGNLWVATSRGIDSFRDLRVISYGRREGLSEDRVDAVAASRDGGVWVTNGSVIDRIGGRALAIPGTQVTSILEDREGRLWAGVDNGLQVFDNGRFRAVRTGDGSVTGSVLGITESANGTIWVEASRPLTLFRIQDGVAIEERVPTLPLSNAIAPDPRGGLYLGLFGGDILHADASAIRAATVRERSPGKFPPSTPVLQIAANPDGSLLWITGGTIFGIRNGEAHQLGAKNGLPCEKAVTFIKDQAAALWLYTGCGLVQIAAPELERWWANPNAVLNPRVFDAFDGVHAGASPFRPLSTRSTDGRLWFSNEFAVQMIDPGHITENPLPPPVHIEEVIADRKKYDPKSGLRLPALTRDLEIDYTALSFVAPQKVRFRFKLEGRDKDWQDPGTRRQAFYSDLRPRNYRFQVMACNNDGVWNQAGAALEFSVAPAWFQTGWFPLVSVTVAGLLLWTLYRYRMRQIAAQLQTRLAAQMSERERIARELHDTLLQSVQGLILRFHGAIQTLPADNGARRAMESALDRADEVLAEGRDRVKGLRGGERQPMALAESLSQAGRELAMEFPASFQVVVLGESQDLHPVVRDELCLIGREALRNAFRHASARQIEVEINYGRSELRIVIRDDGRGFDAAILQSGRPSHWGLTGMRERAQKIQTRLDIWSRPGLGTEIELRVPAAIAGYAHSQEVTYQ